MAASWLSIPDIASDLGISERTIRNGRSEGRSPWDRLKFYRFGNSVRVRRSDYDEWLESCVSKL